MTPEHAFLEAIRESPDDDDLRLVFGDWLDETDDPRGELVRVSVRLSQLLERDPARRELFRQAYRLRQGHELLWLGSLAGKQRDWDVVRGLLALEIDALTFDRHVAEAPEGDRVLRWTGDLELTGDLAGVMRLLGRGRLPLLAGLRFGPRQLGADGVRALARSRVLGGLSVLSIKNNNLGPAEAKALAECAPLASLRELDLENNVLGAEGLQALIESPYLSGVRVLNLRNNNPWGFGSSRAGASIGAPAIRALMAEATFPELRVLRLWRNQLGPAGAAELAESPRLRGLVDLDVSHNGLGEEGAAALAASRYADGLRGLDVAENRLGDGGARVVARSPYLAGLASLRLARNRITDAGVHSLAAADLGGLLDLDLSHNPVGDAGALSLSLSPRLAGLRWLALAGTNIGKVGRDALRQRYGVCVQF